MFNNSPALYRNIVLHVYKCWVTYPCERRSYASMKLENM